MIMAYAEDKKSITTQLKTFWKWLWQSDSWWSYAVFLILVFIFIKFIFLPGLGLIFGTTLPLAIVESSSMDHHSLLDATGTINICGKTFADSQSLNINEYWQTCGTWYEQNTNITKEQFQNFKFKNGFRKGDIMIIVKRKTINIGDTLVFEAGSAHPIIHRIISLNPIQTKGDHNEAQLIPGNNPYNADERNIQQSKVLGTAVLKIPWLGWPKLFIVELWNKIVN